MLARALAAAAFGLWMSPTAVAFDLSDWARRSLPVSQRVLYECVAHPACGKASVISANMLPLTARSNRVEDEQRHQQNVIRQMREKAGNQIANVETDATREQLIEGLRALTTENRVMFAAGMRQVYLDAVLFGPTRSYSIMSSGLDAEQVRRNFEGYARLMALVLDQLAMADRARTGPAASAFTPPPTPQR